MWFDTHCHLQICEQDTPVDGLVARAREADVTEILTLGTDGPTSRRCVEIAREFDVYAAVGIHPNSAAGWDRSWMDEIESLATDERVIAIGESGLDFYRDSASPEDQEACLHAHIALAKETNKTLVLHTRESARRAIDVLTEAGPPERLIFHCWGGADDDLKDALALGAYVGFAGNVTFGKAEDLRAAAEQVPSSRLLIETDSPYLAPVPQRGKPNEPAFVAHTGAFLAKQWGMHPQDIAQTTTANAHAVFGLSR